LKNGESIKENRSCQRDIFELLFLERGIKEEREDRKFYDRKTTKEVEFRDQMKIEKRLGKKGDQAIQKNYPYLLTLITFTVKKVKKNG
jgi:hypothetical protein